MTNLQVTGSLRSQLKGFMFKFLPGMINCREFETFLVEYFEGDLSAEQSTAFERHLKVCRECRGYLAAYKRTMEITASGRFSSNQRPPGEIPEDLLKAILDAKRY